MRLLHVPYCFYPDPVGGTEVYVEGLARCQQSAGMEVMIAAPGRRDEVYLHGSLQVYRYRVNEPTPSLRDLYGDGDPTAVEGFARILDRTTPDLLHLHAFTSGVSLRLLRLAKSRGLPVVFTYHTPAVSCVRGTLMRWGSEICDGYLDARLCAACSVEDKGVPRLISIGLAYLPDSGTRWLSKRGLAGGLWTALRMPELVALRHDAFRALMSEADHVVAVCEWVRDVMVRNGVDPAKVSLSRQGLSQEWSPDGGASVQDSRPDGVLRLVFAGRLNPIKGIELLARVIADRPSLPVTLDILGVAQDPEGQRILKRLTRLSHDDSRIRVLEPRRGAALIEMLAQYDLVAVPSQCLETGPMVVYEAFAAGVPVIGSRQGGIAELVKHGTNGWLVGPGSKAVWAGALKTLAKNPEIVTRLRVGITTHRHIRDAVGEMNPIYHAVLDKTRASLKR